MTSTNPKHFAVVNFSTEERETEWLTRDEADALYATSYSHSRDIYGIRSRRDPRWAHAPASSNVRQLPYVKLDRTEREHLLDIGRRAGDLEGAKDAMLDALLADGRFEDLDVTEVSDYAWAAAKFCYPREWAESWR